MNDAIPDVLVVGAGPTGLTMGSELLRHGLTCRLVEELDAPVIYSKAAVVHARTMEVFDDMGVAARLLARARLVSGVSVFSGGKRVAHVPFAEVDSPFPHPYGISQADTERALAEHFTSLGGTVERGKKVEALVQRDDGVTVTLSGGETVGARWVVGCDGAHSVVRKQTGCSFEGAPYEERLIQADVRVDLPGAPDDEILAFLHEDGPVVLFPLFTDGRYRLIVLQPPGSPELEPTLEVFQRVLEARGPRGAKVSDPAWTIGFRIHHRRTDRYRVGRAFLGGDAAHIHSPVGGQGMNTGIQDAYNLAWKLALVQRGAARPELLDSYEAERAPVAQALLDATDRAMQGLGIAASLRHPVATALRNQLLGFVTSLSVVRSRALETLAMLSVGYPNSPIVRQDRPPVWDAALQRSHTSEEPSLGDWAAFGEAPGPGERAVDAPLGDGRSLFSLFHRARHVALLFDGSAATVEGYRNLEAIGARLEEKWGEWIDVHVVVPYAAKPAELRWEGSLVLDPQGAVHKRYGARSECAYVVRPDGYVGYRGQPADEGKIVAYLETIFR
ncbi:MAG TPA: FAD-dependent monooxygenase [Polyangiaceae bacterium]|jgi:2-polyprenyl-6-methoxyphenol hydroxylase-like FAD-dependent oxidoreductase